MTFSKRDISNISVEMDDDWQQEDDGTWSVMITGLEGFACLFFNVDLDEEYPDGWVDTYAIVEPDKTSVTGILFVLQTNDDGLMDKRELFVKITNEPEMKALYAQMEKTGGREFRDTMAGNEGLTERLEEMSRISNFLESVGFTPVVVLPTASSWNIDGPEWQFIKKKDRHTKDFRTILIANGDLRGLGSNRVQLNAKAAPLPEMVKIALRMSPDVIRIRQDIVLGGM